MPFERTKEYLSRGIETALSDPTLREFMLKAGLRETHIKDGVLKEQQQIWTAIGVEIEEYDRAESKLKDAEENYHRGVVELADSLNNSALFPAIGSSPESFSSKVLSTLLLAAACAGFADIALSKYFGWTEQSAFLQAKIMEFATSSKTELPPFLQSENLLWYLIAGVSILAFLFGISLIRRGRRFVKDRDLLEKQFDLKAIREDSKRLKTKIDEALVLKGVLPAARVFINDHLKLSYETSFPAVESRGLGEVHDSSFDVQTAAHNRLRQIMETMNGGSIGIAGPRGAGKSTTIRSFCEEREWKFLSKQVLSVMTPAPARYDPRDFILHLFSIVCRRVAILNRIEIDKITWIGNGDRHNSAHPILLFAYRFRLAITSMGLSLILLGLYVGFHTLFTVAPPLHDYKDLDAIDRMLQVDAALIRMATAFGLSAGSLILWGLVFLFATGTLQIFGFQQFERDRQSQLSRANTVSFEDALSRSPTALATEALRLMRSIKFQQSYTSGWSGSLKFPIGVDMGKKEDISTAERPLSLPEIVTNLRIFLQRASSDFTVIIGIDELDKIHPEEDAERFLNDIKVIFGIEGVFFLVSVSENALSAFERKGIPIRNAFDSCFDDILHVRYLTLSAAREVVQRRILGMPYPFLCLCHCLSGGLPRDLIRVCRNLLIEAQDKKLGTLKALCSALMQADISAKVHALEFEAGETHSSPALVRFLTILRSVQSNSLSADALRKLTAGLSSPLRKSGNLSEERKAALWVLNQLRYDLFNYLSFACLILEFFCRDAVTKEDIVLAESNGFFEDVAQLRQALAANPDFAAMTAQRLGSKYFQSQNLT